MTDQLVQNNENSSAATAAGNTLPIKSNGNAARSVNYFAASDHCSMIENLQMNHSGSQLTALANIPIIDVHCDSAQHKRFVPYIDRLFYSSQLL